MTTALLKKQIELLEKQIELIEKEYKTKWELERVKHRLVHEHYEDLHNIIVKEGLIGTKYFCSCHDCEINYLFSSEFEADEHIINIKAFCSCHDAKYLPLEIFYKWFPNRTPPTPPYSEN